MIKSFCALACASVALNATISFADSVKQSGAMCTRGITMESLLSNNFLSTDEKKAFNNGEQVAKFIKQSNGYYIGYIFQIANYDAELVMGVFSSANEHAGDDGLGDFIKKSKIVAGDEGKNPFKVELEQQVDWPYDNGRYTVENTLTAFDTPTGTGYIQDAKLLSSTDASFSPEWMDAYVQAIPKGNGVFVVACNYMVPRGDSFKGKFNDKAVSRLKASGRNLLAWVKRVANDPVRAPIYRTRLKALAVQQKRL